MSMIKTLGTFTLEAQIGKGGMGEVYRAKDQKLGRDVAIKVLPEEFAKDADRVARFQREAKLLASLNHPNIAAIHGLEESEGTHFLVLELIEGDTLADRLKRGAIPVEESLKLALQIAEALEAAHEKGVIHRDLKPANIKVTPDGKVKVLDFGLAKAFAGEQAEVNLSQSPTLSEAATQQGVILGTAAYMSPEQARGYPVDKRADIWAFGVVLFEMLTGRQIFSENTVSDTLASVLKTEPDWQTLPPNLHPRIRLLLERCLEKEPKDRYSGVADARVDIQKVLEDPSGIFAQAVTIAKPRKKVQLGIPWVAAIAILCIIVALVFGLNLRTHEPRQVHRFDYDLPEDLSYGSVLDPSLTVSPDGTKIIYVANGQLLLKKTDELTARPIQGTDEDPENPFFSPDGQWIGYWSSSDKQLKKIAVMGGSSVMLCEVDTFQGATWNADDMIVFGQKDRIMRISANDGMLEEIVRQENERLSCPQILPNGKAVLFTAEVKGAFQVVAQSLETGDRKYLLSGDCAKYLPTGHLVYGLENNISAIQFDPEDLKMTGVPFPVVEGVFRSFSERQAQWAISDSGTLIYMPGTSLFGYRAEKTLVWVDRNGKEEPISIPEADYRDPRISPDGTKVALGLRSGDTGDVWIWDLDLENRKRLTFNEHSGHPLWTPDGSRIAFHSFGEDKNGVYWKKSDGTGNDELIYLEPVRVILPHGWSENGKTLVIEIYNLDQSDIASLSIEGDQEMTLLLDDKYHEYIPQISHDGRWMAYSSDESGQFQIYVRPFPEVNEGYWQVSTEGGVSPLWSPDGRELFYRNGDSVIKVAVETEPTFKPGKPFTLFSGTYISGGIQNARPWDISPDGKRFLMIKPSATSKDISQYNVPPKINIVLNWFEELKQRIPVD